MTSFDDTRTRTWAGHKVDRNFGMISRTSEVCFIHVCAQWIQIHTIYIEESMQSTTRKTTHTRTRDAHPFLITPLPRTNCYHHFADVCMRACLCVCVSSVHVFTNVLRVRSKFLKQVYSQERNRREHSEDQAKLLRKFRKKHITRNEMMRRKPLRNKRAIADQKKRR